jgi:adenylate kinase
MTLLSRVILISGTPGVGKSTVGNKLESKGYPLVRLNDFILTNGLYYGYDYTRESVIIDEEILQSTLSEILSETLDLVFIEGHIVEFVPSEFVVLVIVLRCNPGILHSRLTSSRDYSKAKIEENVQAEIMDECLLNLKEQFPDKPIIEIDTTNLSIEDIVDRILALTLTLK